VKRAEWEAAKLAAFSAAYPAVKRELTGLWRYGLEHYRLELVASEGGYSRFYEPVWQMLLDDVVMGEPTKVLHFKRAKPKPGETGVKNMLLAVGNLLTCYAKFRFTPEQAHECLKHSGIYDALHTYMFNRACAREQALADGAIFDFVKKGLDARILGGNAA